MIAVIPNTLSHTINAKLDAAIAKVPEAAKSREVLYQQLLEYFDEHGIIPDFELHKLPNQPLHPTPEPNADDSQGRTG